jgi:hypothetical protein
MFDAALLALIAGCADALAYLRFHTFAGFMNGNTVFLGLRLSAAIRRAPPFARSSSPRSASASCSRAGPCGSA